MDYVMLVTDDKEIISTRRIPIFNGEQNSDNLKILFPLSVEDTSPTSPDTMRTLHFPHTPFPLHGLSINMFCASKISRRLAPGS